MKRRSFLEGDLDLLPVEIGGNDSTLSTCLSSDVKKISDQILLKHYDEIKKGELTESELVELIYEYSEFEGITLQPSELEKIKQEILKEESPFGILEPLIAREDVSDIIVAGWDKIYTISNRRVVPCSNLQFESPNAYKNFVDKLLFRAGTYCNTKKPISDGAIGNVRINCVHESISQGGPYLTLRVSRFASVSLQDLEEKGLAQAQILDYLRCLILIQKTILIAGEVGTGKTTLVRALANTIPHAENIVVIEDTPEIKLDHPYTRYLLTREANTESVGEITQSQCVWAGMRMGMNRIIVGEIRDPKAAEAFIDVCASGHSGLSTIHAKSCQEALSRLCLFLSRAQKFTDESAHLKHIGLAVGAIVHLNTCPVTKKRRIFEVVEVSPGVDQPIKKRVIAIYKFKANGEFYWEFNGSLSQYKEEIVEFGLNPAWINK